MISLGLFDGEGFKAGERKEGGMSRARFSLPFTSGAF